MCARELNSTDLGFLRAENQFSKLYLSVLVPAVKFRCRVKGTPASLDGLAIFDYDGGDGNFAAALAGMTVYIGTSQDSFDVGMARLRIAPTADSGSDANGFKIGEESELDIADDHYVSVVDAFEPWPRHIRITSAGVVYADFDVTYSNQHAVCNPAVVMGPPAISWLQSGSADVAFDASDTWSPTGSPATYAWTAIRCATGAAAGSWDNAAIAAPTLTLATADLGTVRVNCVVTMDDAAGGSGVATGYRYVFVYNAEGATPTMPTTQFTLGSCSGDWMTGGWSFKVTLYDEALRSEIRDRTLIVLHAQDWYGSTKTSVGPITDNRRANVIAVGWVAGESITDDPVTETVTFTVQGPHWWLDHMSGFPVGIEDYAGTPSEWYEFGNLTPDRGLWHFLVWASTMTMITDVTLTGDTREISVFDAPAGTLWQQLNTVAEQAILARLCADRYGRLYAEINSQVLTAGRAGITVVQDIETQDWRDEIAISRQTIAPASLLDLSGVAYAAAAGTPYFSLSPGHVFKHYGIAQRKERLALVDQATSNMLTGLILGYLNNEYPHVTIPLASNHRAIDVCPHQYVTMSLAAGDTERGIVWTTKKLIPRRVSFKHNPQSGTLLTTVEVEGYTTGELAVDGDAPAEAPSPSPPGVPTLPPLPPSPPTVLDEPDIVFVWSTAPNLLWRTADWTETNPTWTDITGTLSDVQNIQIDQVNRYIYVMSTDGLYKGSADSASPAWVRVFDPANPPAGVQSWQDQWTVALDGRVALVCRELNTCSVCDVGHGLSCLVIIAPDGSTSVLYSQYGCGRSNCCPLHSTVDRFATGSSRWRISVAGTTFRFCMGGRRVGADCCHLGSAKWSDANYDMTTTWWPGPASHNVPSTMCDLDGLLIGTYGDALFSLTPGSPGTWQDITPGTGFVDADLGFDRDAQIPTAYFSDGASIYKSSGGVPAIVTTRAGLAGSPGILRHISCYCGDAEQAFLAIDSTGGDGFILTTRDSGGTWTDKTGNLAASNNFYELRAVWTEA